MRLIDYFDRGADLYSGRDCLHDGTRGWTYADGRATTHRVANGLLGRLHRDPAAQSGRQGAEEGSARHLLGRP